MPNLCSIDDCPAPAHCRGWCEKHYARWKRHGDPFATKTTVTRHLTNEERFWFYVQKGEGCWTWTGTDVNSAGYGRIALNGGGKELVHRYSVRLHGVDIPEGWNVDHLCRNPSCVNPDHLEPATQSVNIQRARIANGTAAHIQPHGTRPRYNSGCRCDACRTHMREYGREWRRKKLERGDFDHGLRGYDYGCKCEVCMEAMRDYFRKKVKQ